MALPHGDIKTGKSDEKHSTTEKPCLIGVIKDDLGNCINDTDRVFDVNFNQCKKKNEVKNIHGNCVDGGAVVIFDDDY